MGVDGGAGDTGAAGTGIAETLVGQNTRQNKKPNPAVFSAVKPKTISISIIRLLEA